MSARLLHLVGICMLLTDIILGEVMVSTNCAAEAPALCESSINDALMIYSNESTFKIDTGDEWILSLSASFSHSNVTFIGERKSAVSVLFHLTEDFVCSDCNIRFENITIRIPHTISDALIQSTTFTMNGLSHLVMQNVNITGQHPDHENDTDIFIDIDWMFRNNTQFICNECLFYDLNVLRIRFYDMSAFTVMESRFEYISTNIDDENMGTITTGFIIGCDSVVISLDGCIVNDNDLSPTNFIRILEGNPNDYTINITSSSFEYNSGGYGGILRLSAHGSVWIKGSTFSNTTSDYGGVLYAKHSDINIIDCNISNNVAENRGGAIWMKSGTLNIELVDFVENVAGDIGGVLYASDNAAISVMDVEWLQNTASGYGACLFVGNSSSVNMISSHWIGNRALSAVIEAFDSDIRCTDCLFEGNIGSDGYGAAIYVYGGNLTLDDVYIINTSAATIIQDVAQGVLFIAYANLWMNNVTMTGNNVEGIGGCIYGFNSIFHIDYSYFANNNADIAGAVMYISDSVLTLTHSILVNNEASSAACIYAYMSSVMVSNSRMEGNIGGCLFINSSYLQLLDSNATYNSAPHANGSVVQITDMDALMIGNISNIQSIIDIRRCIFEYNEAWNGAAVYIDVNHDMYPKSNVTNDITPSTLCGDDDDTFCYYINVSSKANEITTALVHIAAERDKQETTFEVHFNILQNDCIHPTISLFYEDIDMDIHEERLKILNHNESIIAECGDEISGSCNEFANCLENYNLDIDVISMGESYVISLLQSEKVTSVCHSYHQLSTNALLEWSCNPIIGNITNTVSAASNHSCIHSTASLIIKSDEYDEKEIPVQALYMDQEQIGVQYLNNTPFISSYIYGADSIYRCYDIDSLNIDLISSDTNIEIQDTMPTLFMDPQCNDYYDVLLRFQQLDAKGIVLVSQDNVTQVVDDIDTQYWLPFRCIIYHNSSNVHQMNVDYTTLLYWISSIFGTQINTTDETIMYTSEQQRDDIKFMMDVTNKEDIDSDIAQIVARMISTACAINTDACPAVVEEVFCTIGGIINIIQNTNNVQSYNDIVIPVIVVSLNDALQLTSYAASHIDFYVSLTCNSTIQDEYEYDNTTTPITPGNIIAYNTATDVQMAISFPTLTFASFYTTVKDVCKWMDFDLDFNDLESFSVSINTVYNTLNAICIDGDGMQINKLSVDDTSSMSTVRNCTTSLEEYTSMDDINRGTYCFISWKNINNNYYRYVILSLFIWTPSFIHIDNSVFQHNIANQEGAGGVISIISQQDIDELLSVSITNTQFISNSGSCIHREFSFAGIERFLSLYMSILSVVNVSAFIDQAPFLSTDLSASFDIGLVFKNAILLDNIKINGDMNNRRRMMGNYIDSAIYLQRTNAWIGSCVISNLYTNKGAIYLRDTALQLFDSVLSNNTADYGAGLYQHVPTTYEAYDVCLSLIDNVFSDNEAVDTGGAMYIHLIGSQGYRESCIHLLKNAFMNNTANIADNIYFNISNGYHSVLDNNETLNTICNINNDKCNEFYSSVATLCIATNLADTEKCASGNLTQIIANLSSNPGASESIYAVGHDVFGNLISTTDYSIKVSSDTVFIITPDGTHIDEYYENVYFINILIDVEANITGSRHTVSIADVNGIAETGIVNININDCQDTEYKYRISDEVYTCQECASGLYTIDSSQCKVCPDDLTCNIDEIIVKQSHHVNEAPSEYENEGLELQVAVCPPGYCCIEKSGCAYESGTNPDLCASNRNASVRMCGACNDGFSETTSSKGNCRTCDQYSGTLTLVVYCIFGYLVVFIIFHLSTSERTVPKPLSTYVNRTLFFYYQILAFITFRTYIPMLHTITDIANLNLTTSQQGSCLYLANAGPRNKLVMSLTIPAILTASFIFTFIRYYLRNEKVKADIIQREEGWWHARVIAFSNTADVLVRTIYLQLTYIFLRLCMCSGYPDGKWYMWYAGQVECFDAWQITSAVFCFFFVIILPYILYRVQLKYKYNNPDKFAQVFANTILSYRQPCWYYGVIDLFRRAVIVVISITTYSSWMIVATGCLLVFHCTLMPYRWRVNNMLEMFVLSIIFLEAVLNDTDASVVNVQGFDVDFDPVMVVFAFLPLLPVPWLVYECFDWSELKQLHFIIYTDFDSTEEELEDAIADLPKPSDDSIVMRIRCGKKNFTWYSGLKIINANYGSIQNSSLDPMISEYEVKPQSSDVNDNDDEKEENEETKTNEESMNPNQKTINKSEHSTTTAISAISATPTRSGWKYPFKLTFTNCCPKALDEIGDQSVTVDLIVTFSDDIPHNTFIDSTDIGQHLSYWTSKLGCTIVINRVSGKSTEFVVEFTAIWHNLQNLDADLLKIGYDVAMEEEIFNALDHNNELRKDLMKAFKIPPSMASKEGKEIKLIDVEIKGSLTNEDRNKFLMQQLLHQHSLSNEEEEKELDAIKYLPLHRWNIQHLKIKMKHWILNDCQHKQRTQTLMEIFSHKSLSGKKIVNLDNELQVVLKNCIANELLMTQETFTKIIEYFREAMCDERGKDKIRRNSAPKMALLISRIPLENILHRIDAEQINGAKFIKFYFNDYEWISEVTGWAQTEILQIETVLFKHHTYDKFKLYDKLSKNLENNMGLTIKQEFMERIKTEDAEDYIDLEILHLKLTNGYPIDEETLKLMNIVDDLHRINNNNPLREPLALGGITEDKGLKQSKYKIKVTSASEAASDNEDNKYQENDVESEQEFIPNVMKSIAACFALNVESEKQLNFDVSTRNIMRQKSPSDDTLADIANPQNQQRMKISKQTDWACSNCSNYNHKFYVGGKLVENWKECTLCGIKELNSVVRALDASYTYVTAARSMYDKEAAADQEAGQGDGDNENINDCAQPILDDTRTGSPPTLHHLQRATQDNLEILLANDSTFDLRKIACPLRQSQKACRRVRRLAHQLKSYQEWIKKVRQEGNGKTPSVEDTSHVDLTQLKNEDFSALLMECASKVKKIKDKHKKELKSMLDVNSINSEDMATLSKSDFVNKIAKGTSIKAGFVNKFYKRLKTKCQETVSCSGYHEYINALDFRSTEDDFFHVLNYHIKYGGQTKLNTFAYFREIVDCHIDECDSKARKKTRVERFKTKMTEEVYGNVQEIDPFGLNLRYAQNQLDVMHYFLVHPQERAGGVYHKLYTIGSSRSVIRSGNTLDFDMSHHKAGSVQLAALSEEQKGKSYSTELEAQSAHSPADSTIKADQHKYITEISTDDDAKTAQYGFGVDHSYPHLRPKLHTNLRDELLFNNVCKVRVHDFEDIIMRALKMQRFAVKEKNLRCKHYESEYNIIRNESIGIRHILSIIVYTDLSEFCTAFRATYRAIKKNESDQSVTQRHRDLYFYSRSLFEAIEFFGNSMESNMRVYHGLSEVMMFERFSAYFNQPVSTTVELDTALKFSRGTGIILEFKRGGSNPSLIPKYLDVSWMSIYPEEDERLFYGDNIVFEIYDIVETRGKPKKHKRELRILNMFQKLVKNQCVVWTRNNEKETGKLKSEIADLVWLIKHKIEGNEIASHSRHSSVVSPDLDIEELKEAEEDHVSEHGEEDDSLTGGETMHALENLSAAVMIPQRAPKKRISRYGRRLFQYFCDNPKTTWICINNYQSIPSLLKNALLYTDDRSNRNQQQLSFVKLLKVFGCLEKVVLNELNVKQMTEESKHYVKAVSAYIQHINVYKNVKKKKKRKQSGNQEEDQKDTEEKEKSVVNKTKLEYELEEIVFESVPEIDSKPNSTLQKLALHYKKNFEQKTYWTISYKFLLERTHTLTFKNNRLK